jgi:hypothetical protein
LFRLLLIRLWPTTLALSKSSKNLRFLLFLFLIGSLIDAHLSLFAELAQDRALSPQRDKDVRLNSVAVLPFGRAKPVVQFLFCLGLSTLNPIEKFNRSFASPVRKLIAQHDVTAARDFDCAAPFEVAQNARDCLNSQAKIIRDVLTKHWQNDETLTRRGPLGHVYEETDNPFLRSCGQEQEKMTLLTCKLTGCQRQELICAIGFLATATTIGRLTLDAMRLHGASGWLAQSKFGNGLAIGRSRAMRTPIIA